MAPEEQRGTSGEDVLDDNLRRMQEYMEKHDQELADRAKAKGMVLAQSK